jgi:hypothetical protein
MLLYVVGVLVCVRVFICIQCLLDTLEQCDLGKNSLKRYSEMCISKWSPNPFEAHHRARLRVKLKNGKYMAEGQRMVLQRVRRGYSSSKNLPT